ncbi:hypothetical protein HME9302_00977 [Alteripontixanthobacter maritimus]|uniref:Uncharacterized protein n=1 Tax=Alteripontixanthobacter maritimus TaxID=2161824 RepID=A0A369Q5L9_9SPHN|nr:hypothetical protein [Alteripontixanthobacter maritimus]RDC59782.1 hypothetical protein HME9302_00977 [Alteripontixanthobacter maritimus]
MPETVRSLSDILTTFADGQPDASITAQDMRDLIVSSLGQTGWADYQDGQYSNTSPQAFATDTNTTVEIDGAVSQTQELPFGIATFWDNVTNTIQTPQAGSGLMISFETIIRRATGTGEWAVDCFIDIGIAGPVELYPRTISHNKITGDKKITWTTGAYALDTWDANGGKIIMRPSVDALAYKSRVIVHQTHRGRGTY